MYTSLGSRLSFLGELMLHKVIAPRLRLSLSFLSTPIRRPHQPTESGFNFPRSCYQPAPGLVTYTPADLSCLYPGRTDFLEIFFCLHRFIDTVCGVSEGSPIVPDDKSRDRPNAGRVLEGFLFSWLIMVDGYVSSPNHHKKHTGAPKHPSIQPHIINQKVVRQSQ